MLTRISVIKRPPSGDQASSGGSGRVRVRTVVLQQIPKVAVQILEHRHGPVRLLFRLAHEDHAGGDEAVVIAPEVICLQEQENPPAGLLTNQGDLLRRRRTREEERRAAASGRSDRYPALVLLRKWLVLDELEAEHVDIEADGLVIIADQERDVGDGLCRT